MLKQLSLLVVVAVEEIEQLVVVPGAMVVLEVMVVVFKTAILVLEEMAARVVLEDMVVKAAMVQMELVRIFMKTIAQMC